VELIIPPDTPTISIAHAKMIRIAPFLLIIAPVNFSLGPCGRSFAVSHPQRVQSFRNFSF
jgi:hypothetical protein